jgi:hypothetical protein
MGQFLTHLLYIMDKNRKGEKVGKRGKENGGTKERLLGAV